MPPGQVVTFIIGTVVILFGAYYVTYYIGMKASGRTRATFRNRTIVIRDRFNISRDRGFYVVEIAGKVYVVGVASNSMTLLDTIDAAEFAELSGFVDEGLTMPWGDTPVGRYGNSLTKKVVAFVASIRGQDNSKSTFASSMKKAEEEEGGD